MAQVVTRRIPPVRRLLMDAKALIAKPENWCKGTFAKSAKGRPVPIDSAKACRFCAYGAVLHAEGKTYAGPPRQADMLLDTLTLGGLVHFNDAPTTTHPMVMRLFNKAIRRAKEQRI